QNVGRSDGPAGRIFTAASEKRQVITWRFAGELAGPVRSSIPSKTREDRKRMRTMKLGTSGLEVPVVAVGCMRINSLDQAGAERFIRTSLEEGANFFDHADIYGGGTCEEIFANAIGMNASI